MRRPSRDLLEALVSTALLGCGGSSAPPAPPAASAVAIAPAPEPEPDPEPAPAATRAPLPTPQPAPRLALPPFTGCTGPVPPPKHHACADETEKNLVNLRPACAVDALVLFEVGEDYSFNGTLVPGKAREVARAGEPCAAAADKDQCEAGLKTVAFPLKSGFSYPLGTRVSWVVARGTALEAVSNREQLVSLIGPVDSRHDAAALLWLDGWGGACSGLKAQGTAFVDPKYRRYFSGCGGGGAQLGEDESAYPIPPVPKGDQGMGDYRLQVDRQGTSTVSFLGRDKKQPVVRCGRSPSGMELTGPPPGASEVGAYLATSAELEAAAVIAFELLASELATHGAPTSLVERCLIAAEDERRHTALMTAAARRYGAEPVVPAPLQRPLPTLLELARENTVEGCVRETWGAVSAALQARTAQDALLAQMYASIAPDELNHAELSWDIQEWLSDRTGCASHLDDLAQASHASLVAEQSDPPPDVAWLTGAPLRATACQLLAALG